MKTAQSSTRTRKISTEFYSRLTRLKPKEKIRVIAMLATKGLEKPGTRREKRQQRQKIIESIRNSAQTAFADIDRILKRFHGKRLAGETDALGCIPIETTAAGISALVESDYIKTILEDQPVSLLHSASR